MEIAMTCTRTGYDELTIVGPIKTLPCKHESLNIDMVVIALNENFCGKVG